MTFQDKLHSRFVKAALVYLCVLLFPLAIASAAAEEVDQALRPIIERWDEITFRHPENDKEKAYQRLAKEVHALTERYPNRAEPLVWEGVILSTYAGAKGGLGALSLIKQSRELLLAAEKIDASAEQGSIYTTLGSLYYEAPGWPISFGNNKTAENYLKKALMIDPDGIDPNYFYGDYLIERGRYAEAVEVLEQARRAPPREGRKIADTGRQRDIEIALKRAREYLK